MPEIVPHSAAQDLYPPSYSRTLKSSIYLFTYSYIYMWHESIAFTILVYHYV